MQGAGFAEAEHFGMGTVMMHRAHGITARAALQAVQAQARHLEGLLSRFLPESDISRVNRAAGICQQRVGEDAFQVLSRAKKVSEHSQGRFDITIRPLVDLWSQAKKAGVPPTSERILGVLPLAGHAGLLLDPHAKTAGLRYPGQSIDLGGIGKGYAADRFLEVFREHGVSSAFTNIGGNVAALGAKPDGSPWRVGIRHPRKEGALIGMVCAEDRAVVTSGDYQRFFIDGSGKRHHHIIDPKTGCPAESGLVSVTVIAASSMDADALSTALFVAGMEEGLNLLKQIGGAEAIFIGTDLRVAVTSGLREGFQPEAGIKIETLN